MCAKNEPNARHRAGSTQAAKKAEITRVSQQTQEAVSMPIFQVMEMPRKINCPQQLQPQTDLSLVASRDRDMPKEF